METYQFIALGGGSAGLNAAKDIARAGRRVALVDPAPVGGTCELRGCNPKKVLVRSTEVLDTVRRAGRFGVEVGSVRLDWPGVIDRKESFTGGVTRQTEESLAGLGIDLIQGDPRFTARDQIEVNGERVGFDALVIATGSTPRPLQFPGAQYLCTSDDLLNLRTIPDRLAIIGAGVIAFEFGQVFARAGSKVTILNRDGRPLMGYDADLVHALAEATASLGLEIVNEATVTGIEKHGTDLSIAAQAGDGRRTFIADRVLNAAGRVPAIDSLGLDVAGVARDDKGVSVSQFLRSPHNPRIFAAGDAHGRRMLSPVASYEGRVVARNYLSGDVQSVQYDSIPQAIYTVPPLATVGLTEDAARAQGLDIRVTLDDKRDWTVYRIAGEDVACAKLISDRRTRRVLGAHLLGAGADDEINVFAMAMRFGLTIDQLCDVIWTYPTFASTLDDSIEESMAAD